MFWLFFVAFFVAFAFVARVRQNCLGPDADDLKGWRQASVVFLIVAASFLAFSVLASLAEYANQVYDREELVMIAAQQEIYELRAASASTDELAYRQAMDGYCEQQIRRSHVLKEMRFRTKNPWVWQFLMPNIEIPAN